MLIPLYEVLVVPEVAQLLLGGVPDLAEISLVTEQLLVEDVPIWDNNVLLLLERGQGRPRAGIAGGDGRQGVRDIFRHRNCGGKGNF